MNQRQKQGQKGERAVLEYLLQLGFIFVTKNFFVSKVGEIDLIMLKSNLLLVVEVKSRLARGIDFDPRLTINSLKINKIKKTLQYFLKSREQIGIIGKEISELNIAFVAGIVCHNHRGKILKIKLISLNGDF